MDVVVTRTWHDLSRVFVSVAETNTARARKTRISYLVQYSIKIAELYVYTWTAITLPSPFLPCSLFLSLDSFIHPAHYFS